MRWPAAAALRKMREEIESLPELKRFRDRRRRARLLLAVEFGAVTIEGLRVAYAKLHDTHDDSSIKGCARVVLAAERETRSSVSLEKRRGKTYQQGLRKFREAREKDRRQHGVASGQTLDDEEDAYHAQLLEAKAELFSDTPWCSRNA